MPSGVLNANWFASNLVRKYPLDSNASCIDDNGNYLPDDIIVDLHISYPDNLGTTCYVSAVNITEQLISIVISVDNTSVAAICIPRPSSMYRYYTMDSLVDGVVALIAIGLDSISTTGHWVFSNKYNSAILPRCCNIYSSISVLSLSRPSDAEPLTGDILLTAGNDLAFTIDEAFVDNEKRKVVFLGLDTITKNPDEILSSYITKCQVSTEMDTCKRRTIIGLSTAIPDCSGNIDIISDDIEISSPGDGIITFSSDKKLPDICKNEPQDPPGDAPRPWNVCPFESDAAPDVYKPCPKDLNGGSDSSSSSRSSSSSSTPVVPSNQVNLYTDVSVIYGGIEYSSLPGFINVVESGDLCCDVFVDNTRASTWHFVVEDSNINKLDFNGLIVNNNNVSYNDRPITISEQLSTLDYIISTRSVTVKCNGIHKGLSRSTYTNPMRLILNGIRLESVIYND